jgi:DEAD/DEAH box helicase domain-containing protein
VFAQQWVVRPVSINPRPRLKLDNTDLDRHMRFVSCSATISNPRDHMKRIFGLECSEIEAIVEDGAPAGPKEFLVWNPSYIDPAVPSLGRHSSLSDATMIMRFLMKRGARVILFCKV